MSSSERKLYLQERRSTIEELITENGRISVEDLTIKFGVSNVTIRNDLAALEEAGILRRTHGGAIAISSNSGLADPIFAERQTVQAEEKDRIGRAAAALVEDGDIIALDNGTTAYFVARYLGQRRDLTVVTNCLPIAVELDNQPGITVMVTGGAIHSGAMALVGEWARNNLSTINVDKAFMTCKGISADEGLTDVNSFIVETKRTMASVARQTIAIADYTKWGRKSFAAFAHLGDVDMVITDSSAPQKIVTQIRSQGVNVVVV